MKNFKIKKYVLIAVLAFFSIASISFVNDYFELTKNLEIYSAILKEVNLTYVDEVDNGKLIKKSIDSMLEDLDPYTNYIPESKMEDYNFMTTGQYGGIGALIRKNGDYVVISEPYKGFPADKFGLKAGDKILEIDGNSMKGKNTSDVSEVLKGQPKTNVNVLIERYGVDKPLKFTLTREEIKVNSVPYFGMVTDEIGYVKLTSFTNTATKEVKDAITKLKENPKLKSLVLDLRGNPGGLLNEAVDLSNLFVEKGQEVVITKGKVKEWEKSYKTINSPLDITIPLVVLIDRGSASASEIVSGTIQDLDRGIVLGRRSYGKGLVQTTKSLPYNSKIKITTAKYYIPSGRCIQAKDYSHKNEDGSAGTIPDSMFTNFKTKKGRKVQNGGGINPDIKVEAEKFHDITVSLMSKSLIFDYATEFVSKNKTIADAKSFVITDAEYEKFSKYVENKDVSYTTDSENKFSELKKTLEDEKYFDDIATEFTSLQDKIKKNKKSDIQKHKAEIKSLLEQEIVTRYYYQEGGIVSRLKTDADLTKAIDVLRDANLYKTILDGTYKAPEVKK